MDQVLERIIREKARTQHQSLSEIANQLLKQALGLENASMKKRNLRNLSGKWTKEEAAAFDQTQEAFSRIDEELWK